MKRSRKEFKPRTLMCKDQDGNVLTEQEEVLQRWTKYYRTKLEESNNEAIEQIAVDLTDDRERKAPTPEGVTADPCSGTACGFADDLAVVATAKKEDALQRKLNIALDRLANWIRENQLTVVLEETEAGISTKRKEVMTEAERFGMDCICLTETKQKGQGNENLGRRPRHILDANSFQQSVSCRQSFGMLTCADNLTLKDEYEIIKRLQSGEKQSEICREMKLKVDQSLLKCFSQQKANVTASGAVLQTKAEDFGNKLLKDGECKLRRSWVDRFKKLTLAVEKLLVKQPRRAWMTSEIFKNELQEWNDELLPKKRRILLLIDNCPVHLDVKDLDCIKLVFMPSNTSSKLQLIDQGVIHILKSNYRRLLLAKMINAIDTNENFSINLLDVINFIHMAWQNCFCHGGFVRKENEFDSDDDLPLMEWLKKNQEANDNDEQDEFAQVGFDVHVDDNLVRVEFSSDDTIIACVENQIVDNEMEAEEKEEIQSNEIIPVPTTSDAIRNIEVILNRRNVHYWSSEDSHWMRETNLQRRWSINI
ncbi:hypothetical protein ILUMI_09715 [Ignelater luminosus]|uniref:DDE-1 domain-containing protein n=1 Tax=Ignelater luminosus TaxID=2038154 RepID=A0A8K0GET2_IGNLU|nr:hypothetical protein ILUMI_09715 [Ignelater luminosus]